MADASMHRYRSHTCGALRKADIGSGTRLSGWVHRVRDHGGLLFIDLRDHYGLTQVVVDPDTAAFKTAERLRSEWVVRIDGKVRERPEGTNNAELATGEIEVYASEIEVLSEAKELPVPVFGEPDYPEDMRLTYRFLDLRRETLHGIIMKRLAITRSIRARMHDASFNEFPTPILTASSPEGARDFLVPSRIHAGKFYALPQAPQQYKQLLMMSGFDRYFQIAPCFRDEDPRADRLPGEFYQLDVEMSFVEQDDVLGTMEPIIRGVFEEFADGKPVTPSFPRIPYDTAIAKYGSDKPDLRNPIEMQDVTEHFRGSGFKVFAGMIEKDPKVRVWAIPAKTGGSRAFCDRMNAWAQKEGQPGLGYIFWREVPSQVKKGDPDWERRKEAEIEAAKADRRVKGEDDSIFMANLPSELEAAGPIAKNIGTERTEAMRLQLRLGKDDTAFFVAGDPARFYKFAGLARDQVGRELKLIDENRFAFCWIVDFPFYEWNEDEKKIDFSHNPFSMPQGGAATLDAAKSTEDYLAIKAYQYDLVCNGYELASGGIRNHRPDTMVKAFGVAGLGPEVVEARFGALYRAFQFGAPPHGGMAAGIERMVMLLTGCTTVRDVALFPMNQQASDLLMGAPSEAANKQLNELHIRLNLPQKKS
jgi:aspartyl-tRNA synthetase